MKARRLTHGAEGERAGEGVTLKIYLPLRVSGKLGDNPYTALTIGGSIHDPVVPLSPPIALPRPITRIFQCIIFYNCTDVAELSNCIWGAVQ